MDKVDRVYEVYSILSESGDKISDHEKEYKEILDAAKGNATEKGLACQFIPKFLKHFPNLSETALDAQLDLAEDDDITVRKMSVKHLPGFCKVSTNFVPKIADILTQMLLTDDSSEFCTVQSALVAIIQIDVKGTLQGILTQISNGDEDAVRKRAIEFLSAKLKVLPEDLLTKEVEEFFLEFCKKVFPKVSGEHFLNLLTLVCNLKIAKTIQVQNTIVDIIASQLDDDAEFDVSANAIDGFMTFMKRACPLFSPFVSSHKFVSYICLKIFPLLDEIKNLDNGLNLVLDIFKMLAEISPYVRKKDHNIEFSEITFNELLKFIPLPPENSTDNDDTITSDPDLYFTHIECLLFTFSHFLKNNDDIITDASNLTRFKDLKIRLQFLSRIISRALKRLKDFKEGVVIMNEDSKLKAIAELTMNNLNVLIKDFFRNPPSFRSYIHLSWKPVKRTFVESGVKRHYESSSSGGNFVRKERKARELYVPPSGKYSSRLSSKDDSSATGKGGRF